MRVVTLVENTKINKKFKKKHGLSFYIETKRHKVLFDLGPDKTFIENSEKLGVDLKDVDIVVISHGHIDHGGGLDLFFQINKKAKVYINKNAFSEHYTKILGVPFYVGLDKKVDLNKRIIFIDGEYHLNEEILIFSDINGNFNSKSNESLYIKNNNNYEKDDFRHEQNLIIKEDKKAILFTGCSHRGILNIYNTAVKHYRDIDIVIGGFHLFNPVLRSYESKKDIESLAFKLSKLDSQFYTCHCTGKKAYGIMKDMLKDQIEYLSTGQEINI